MLRLQRALWLVCAFSLIGGSAALALVDRETKTPVRGLFYEVTGTKEHPAKSKLYLLGSIHVADESVYPLPERIEKAFQSSAALVVEANVATEDSGAAVKFMTAGMYPPGSGHTLRGDVPPRYYAEVEAGARDLGVSMTKLDAMKPWMAAIMLEAVEAAKAGLNPKLGIDMHFLTRAKRKTIVELEGVQDQLDLFNNLPNDQQVALLTSTVRDRAKFKDDLDRLFKAWRSGDAKAIEDIIEESATESPELKPAMEALLTRRNNGMVAKIAPFLGEKESHFVVVGAAHLVGPDGIAEQLKKQGFNVTQP